MFSGESRLVGRAQTNGRSRRYRSASTPLTARNSLTSASITPPVR